jgi:hypothetical protein
VVFQTLSRPLELETEWAYGGTRSN